MALDFTTIKDAEGPAVYLLHDGSHSQQRRLEEIADKIRAHRSKLQTVVISVRDPNGDKLQSFYSLPSAELPHILVVRDNDELAYHWSGQHIPTIDVIIHTANTISSPS